MYVLRSFLVAVLLIVAANQYSLNAQSFPSNRAYNYGYTPIWKYYGNVDPYSRPNSHWIWQRQGYHHSHNALGHPATNFVWNETRCCPSIPNALVAPQDIVIENAAAANDSAVLLSAKNNDTPDVNGSIDPAGNLIGDKSLIDNQDSPSDLRLQNDAQDEVRSNSKIELLTLELEKRISEVAMREAELQNLRKAFEQKKSESDGNVETAEMLNQLTKELKAGMEILEKENKELRNVLRDVKQQAQASSDRLKQADEVASNLRANFEATTEKLTVEKRSLDAKLRQREKQLARLQSEYEDLNVMMSKLKSQGKERNNRSNARKGEQKTQTKRLLAEAMSRARKESAWEISKLRKEAEAAKQELMASQIRSTADKEKLLKRLKATEAKLKALSAKSKSPSKDKKKSSNKKTGKHPQAKDSNKKISLAELAEKKRLERNSADSKQKRAAKTQREECESEIDRRIAQIKKRFEAKIKRAKQSPDSKAVIAKLKKEMQIQMEKMEQRIRNRHKNK